MNTRNTRRFRLNGMTLALAVALPGMLASQMVCAETKAEARTGSAQKATKQQKEETIQVIASPGSESATSTLKAPVSTGALGTASAFDTPFSVSTVTEKEIQDKQISTLHDLVASDASLNYSTSSYTNNRAGGLFIRGINLPTSLIHINGLTTNSQVPELPPEMFERVDILKGATGFMYGFGAPGGIINYVTKKPTKETLLNVTAGYKSQGVFSQHLDAGGRGGQDDRLGYRLNLLNEQGKPTMKDGKINRENVALSLDARATDNLTFTADLLNGHRHIKNPTSQYFQTTNLKGHQIPTPVNFRNIVARLSDGSINTRTRFTQLGAKLELGNDWQLQSDYFWNDDKTRFISPYTNILNDSGDYLMKVYDMNVHSKARGYNFIFQGPWSTQFAVQNIAFGITETSTKFMHAFDSLFQDVGHGNIHQNGIFPHPRKNSYDMQLNNKTTERSVFISDRITFNDKWELLAGVRHTAYKQQKPHKDDYTKNVNTPTLALIFKPEANTSIYTSYVEALEQGSTVGPQYKNANEMLSPLKSKQYEVGVKTDQNRWSATAALFRIERGAAYANADNVWVQDGEERYQGLELGGKVIISQNIDFSASTMWLDPTYRDVAPTKKNIEGKTVAGVPRFKSAVELGWMPDSLPDIRTSLRWRHEGSASPDEQNNIRVPSHDLLDLYVNYDTDALGTPVTARFGVTNLTDKKYWSAAAGKNSIFIGEPRTFMANVTVRF